MYGRSLDAIHGIMKTLRTAIFLFTVTSLGFAVGGCSMFHHHQPKSSFKIIPEGDRNPFIQETPYTERDSPTTKVEVETSPVGQ